MERSLGQGGSTVLVHPPFLNMMLYLKNLPDGAPRYKAQYPTMETLIIDLTLGRWSYLYR